MNTYIIILQNKEYLTNITEKKTEASIIRYCKTFMSRKHKINIFEILKKGIDMCKCPFCGNYSSYILDYEIIEMKVFLKGLKLRNSHGFDDYHCHLGKKCLGSSLNPNSIEYVSKSFNLTTDIALEFIHSRNKTLFYKKNHNSESDYKRSQTRDLEWYVQNYGNDGFQKFENMKYNSKIKNTGNYRIPQYGLEAYKELLKKKTLNISWWKTKYPDNWELKRQEWILKTRCNKFYSKESIFAFDKLISMLNELFTINEIKWKTQEYSIYDYDSKKMYYYDLYFSINERKFIIEYDTPFMHPNEDYMDIEELKLWKNPFNLKQTYKDKIIYDKRKRLLAESKNIAFFTFYVKNKEDIDDNITNIIKKIQNDIK